MTFKKYEIYSILLSVLIIFDLAILKSLGMNIVFQGHRILIDLLFFLPAILSIFLLALSISAFLKKIEPLKKSGRLVTVFMLTCSLILVIASISIVYTRYSTINKISNIEKEIREISHQQ